MSFTTWKVRKDNCCEGQAQEERKGRKEEEGKYESEGVSYTTDTKTRQYDPTSYSIFLSNVWRHKRDRRLSTTTSADNALILVDLMGTKRMKVLYFYARMLQSLKQLAQH